MLLIVCGFGSWQILRDERAGTSAAAQGVQDPPTALPRDITTRVADPTPLTAVEVFGRKTITVKPGEPGYQVIGVQAVKNCAGVADGRLAALLTTGCTQVVRATLRSPTKAYLATGGIFNLADTRAAKSAYEKIHAVVDGKQGRFKGYAPTGATRALALSSTHLGWDYRGHFLVYCVVARADGRDLADDDPYAQQILYDIIELHLLGSVVESRAARSPFGRDEGTALPVRPSGETRAHRPLCDVRQHKILKRFAHADLALPDVAAECGVESFDRRL